jgi:hypothetical protein
VLRLGPARALAHLLALVTLCPRPAPALLTPSTVTCWSGGSWRMLVSDMLWQALLWTLSLTCCVSVCELWAQL